MGLRSRRKGSRGEYLIRDALRLAGYECDRVPASGAAQGFKGDLRVRRDGKECTVEVKLRSSGFNRLYKRILPADLGPYIMGVEFGLVRISFNPLDIIFPSSLLTCHSLGAEAGPGPWTKFFTRLRTLMGPCAVLAIKDDRRPPVYISFEPWPMQHSEYV